MKNKSRFIFVEKTDRSMLVRNPTTGKALPECGGLVENTIYWRERIKAGIIKEVDNKLKTKLNKQIIATITKGGK